MVGQPRVILSGFGDEAAVNKTAVEQLSVMAALGLEFYSLRFVDVGNGIKNVMQLSKLEIRTLQKFHRDYGMRVATIGSPIGKVKLLDVEDGTSNRYVPFQCYLKEDVVRAIDLAAAFGTKLIRGFSFYHPRGTDPRDYFPEVTDRIGAIAERCGKAGCFFGLEVEANLVGQTGRLLAEIHREVSHPHLLLVFDGANLACQYMSAEQVFEEYQAMRPGIGWMHIKDYKGLRDKRAKGSRTSSEPRAPASGPTAFRASSAGRSHYINEESLHDFVPADEGQSGHETILRDFRSHLPALERKLRRRGVPGVFLDLEPHLKKGGQFGGFSGPDGMGIALRALCRLLDQVGIGYQLRDFDSLRRR